MRNLWVIGWLLAAGAVYLTAGGQSAYLPVYLAGKYLEIFALAIALHRTLTINRDTDLGLGRFALMYLSGLVGGILLAQLAPTIGEANYCWALVYKTRTPPHVFRCTDMPFAFVGFVAAFWVSSALLRES